MEYLISNYDLEVKTLSGIYVIIRYGETILHLAIRNNQKASIISFLIANGANVNCIDA